MLIGDLLNIVFDQADYESLIMMRCLGKRKTKYANRYSVLSYYDATGVKFWGICDMCKKGLMKMIIHVASCVGEMDVNVDYNVALQVSAHNGHLVVVKYLVSIGADIHANDGFALLLSAGVGHLEVIKYLVSVGANIHTNDYWALRCCANNGHLEVVKYLVNVVGANIHVRDDAALRWSAEEGHLEVVKYLVSVGANIHADNDFALQCCAYNGHLELVKYLVSVGANIGVNDNELFDIEMIRTNFSHLLST